MGQVGTGWTGTGGLRIGWDRWDWDRGVFRLGGTGWDWGRSLLTFPVGQVCYRQHDCNMCLYFLSFLGFEDHMVITNRSQKSKIGLENRSSLSKISLKNRSSLSKIRQKGEKKGVKLVKTRN